MKARIITVVATAIVALAFAATALAAPHQSGIASRSHSPAATAGWTYSPTEIKPWDVTRPAKVKPNPSSIRLVKPNPTCIRGSIHGW
jgi:hypothetical protein